MNTTKLIDLSELINKISNSNTLVKYILPVICVLVGILFIRYLIKYLLGKFVDKIAKDGEKERAEELKRKQQKKRLKQYKERQRQINAEFKDTNKMLHKLDDMQEPLDKSKYNDLTMIFDKNGKAIK